MGGIVDFWKKYQLRPMKEIFKTTTLGGHPEKNLAIAAALIGGGTLLPGLLGLGAAGGAAAGGLGEAAIGGAAAGAGGTLGGTAGMFGAAPGMASGLLGGSITPAFTSGLAGVDAGLAGAGGLSAFGPEVGGIGSLAALEGPGAGMGSGLLGNLNWEKGLKGLQMANDLTKQGQQQPQVSPMPRPPQTQAQMSNKDLAELYKRIYGGLYV